MTKLKHPKRSDLKIMTKEAKALKYLRESRKLSLRRVGQIIGYSDTYISHCEFGRIDLTITIIQKLLIAYGYEYEYFLALVEGKIDIPKNYLEDCISILKRMTPEKIKTVKTILQSF